jgi:hypothetical protein
MVLGHQRGCRRARRERRRCHQHCLQYRYDAQDRSRLLPPGRRARSVIDVRRRAMQPHRSPIPAPERAHECIGYRAARRRGSKRDIWGSQRVLSSGLLIDATGMLRVGRPGRTSASGSILRLYLTSARGYSLERTTIHHDRDCTLSVDGRTINLPERMVTRKQFED